MVSGGISPKEVYFFLAPCLIISLRKRVTVAEALDFFSLFQDLEIIRFHKFLLFLILFAQSKLHETLWNALKKETALEIYFLKKIPSSIKSMQTFCSKQITTLLNLQ